MKSYLANLLGAVLAIALFFVVKGRVDWAVVAVLAVAWHLSLLAGSAPAKKVCEGTRRLRRSA